MSDKPADQEGVVINHASDRGVTAVYRSKTQMMSANVLGGIAWGFGSVIGATIVVTLLLVVLNFLGDVPLIGNFVNNVSESIQEAAK